MLSKTKQTKKTTHINQAFFVQNLKTQFRFSENPDRQILEKPSFQPKTQFQNWQKLSFSIKFLQKSAKFSKTQFQISENPVPKMQKPSFPENPGSVDIVNCAQKKPALIKLQKSSLGPCKFLWVFFRILFFQN